MKRAASGMGRRRTPELYRAPFPLYALRVDPSAGLLIAAGGGGAAKTGIKNGVHFLQLEQINGRLSASLLHSHDTETRATMNLALAGNILAAGQDAHCQLLRFQIHQQKGKNKAEKAGESLPASFGQRVKLVNSCSSWSLKKWGWRWDYGSKREADVHHWKGPVGLTLEAWNLAGCLCCRFQGAGASAKERGSPSREEVWR